MQEVARPRRGNGSRGVAALVVLALVAAADVAAQSVGNPPPAPAGDSPSASEGGARLDPVHITGSRPNDVQERRNSTTAKIVIGRDEIDRFGDSTLGDVLKRLPGVTIQGQPGRGGAIRLRGLGSGYTQILLDGERVPPGFSLDSISPDQVERIEILRAPTAETGARAIAGTINIVTRGGYTRRVNDLRVAAAVENGRLQPGATWSRNAAVGDWIVNTTLSAYHIDRDYSSATTTIDQRLDDGAVSLAQFEDSRVRVSGGGVHASARVQWRPQGGTDSVLLTPMLLANRFHTDRDATLVQSVGALPSPYDRATVGSRSGTSLARLNSEWTHRFAPDARVETRAGISRSALPVHSFRTETTGGSTSRTLEETSDSHDTSLTASSKVVAAVLGTHTATGGVEVESNRRDDTRTSLQDGVPILTDFAENIEARVQRLAAYVQDEWPVSAHWSAHAGLRWEGIRTRGAVEEGQPEAVNRSSVWSPLVHAVWKPDPKGRDQVRISLTRSYRSPTLANLIARPAVNTRYPVPGPNTPTQADRAGNPDLRPELATGIDIAVERYLAGSGLLSANVFRRNISDYMRSVTTLETVSYASVPRWVSRVQNVGDAVTQGLELETKFRASDVVAGAPRTDVRANASFFHSRVKAVPGPDNRLDQQPDLTANLGLDHRFTAIPLTLGGNVNWTPGYTTRLSDIQAASVSSKVIVDAYGLWTFNPGLALRLSFSNLDPREYATSSAVDGPDAFGVAVRETATTRAPTFVNVQLRLEMKL